MNQEQLKAAMQNMTVWLSHKNELGKAPVKIECTGVFTYNEMKYYIFKYKAGIFGKWLLGVSGGYEGDDLEPCGHTFSDLQPYREQTAQADCIKMIDRIMDYWKKQAEIFENGEYPKETLEKSVKKETMADKLAKTTYESEKFQKNWAVHRQAFGPILDPAFVENYQMRIRLATALNKLSQRDIEGGLKKLISMQDSCETNADMAAWLYFMGLAFEMAGDTEEMLAHYQEAAEYGHRFYLPYLKVAKQAHQDRVFEVAEENYRLGIQCFDGTEPEEQRRVILSSVYANLGSCLTMMHQYEEAADAFRRSEEILEKKPGRSAGKAILCAALGDRNEAERLLEETALEAPEMLEETKMFAEEILNGTHPQFYSVEINVTEIEKFWNWFVKNQEVFHKLLSEENYGEMIEMLQEAMMPMVSFLERSPELGIRLEADSCKIIFADFFMVALKEVYEKVIQMCPTEIREFWHFEMVH